MKLLCYSCVFLLIIFIGCSSSDSTRRGKLSDAMDAASENHEGERKVDAEYREPEMESSQQEQYLLHDSLSNSYSPVQTDSITTTHAEYVPLSQSKKEYLDSISAAGEGNELYSAHTTHYSSDLFSVGVNFSTGLLSSSDFYGLTSVGVNFGIPVENSFLAELNLSYTYSPVQDASALAQSLSDGVSIYEAGVTVRIPTTPAFTFIGHYFLIGSGVNIMAWDYKNSFQAPVFDNNGNKTGTETISSDQLNGFNLFIGTGIDLTQTLPIHFIGEIIPGIILWKDATINGFDNDIFSPFFYIQCKLKFNLGDF